MPISCLLCLASHLLILPQPKYIGNLLRTAEARKAEQERRTERKVQKEREAEGDEFGDKEAYVTPAYRAKLAELKRLEEEERLRELTEGFSPF